MAQSTSTLRPSHVAGFALAGIMAVLQGVNALRTALDPQGFATYMGLPVDALDALGWVQVYGLRAGFVAVLAAILLLRRDFAALRWMAVAALVMPLGDAWLASEAGAPTAIVARHLGIAVFLVIAALVLARAARRPGELP
ncbi:DUF4267 domain-containing protein [Erythrobacter sp. NE805]|uniref:DUF4267 domain-containing protein n=1 Tax=Erythrobacter sp. NE805 TaxID=3389875 RepID=UPI00396B1CB2